MIHRRQFLIGSAAALASVAAGPASCIDAPRLTLDRAGFEALRGESFRIFDEEGAMVWAELVAIEDGPTAPGLDQFVIRFAPADEEALPTGLYSLYHTRTGEFPCFLQPSWYRPTSISYQVRFVDT